MSTGFSPRWGLTGTLLWSGAILCVTFATQLLVSWLWAVLRYPDASGEDFQRLFLATMIDGSVASVALMVSLPVSLGCIAAVVKLKSGTTLADYLALGPFSWKSLLWWTAVLAAFIAAAEVLGRALGRPAVNEFMTHLYATTKPLWMLWLVLVVAAPVAEELLFRGFMFAGLARSVLGARGAIGVTALLWAAIHPQYDLYDMGGIFLFGLILGAARLRSGSLWVPMALHAISNFVSCLGVALETP